MEKLKLDINELEKIQGGKKYRTLIGFDKNKPIAILVTISAEIAFNPNSEAQLSYILSTGPINLRTYGETDLNPHSVKIYTFDDIRNYSI